MWPFIIMPVLSAFLPSFVSEDSFQKLKDSIRAHGKCFAKLIVWRNAAVAGAVENLLVDGHHRHKAIEELRADGVQIADPEIEYLDFESIGEVKQWMMNHADAARPNWTDLEKVKRLEEDAELNAFLKLEAKKRMGWKAEAGKNDAAPKSEEGKKSKRDGEVIVQKAKMAGMGQDKYRKVVKVLKNPEARKLVEAGKISPNRAADMVQVAEDKHQKNREIFNNQKQLPDWKDKTASLNSIINGDTLEGIPLPDGSVDLIFTSPPYAVPQKKVRYVVPFFTGNYADYLSKLETAFKEFHRVVTAGGYFVLNIDNCSPSPEDAERGAVYYNCYADCCRLAESVGFKTLDVVIWYKQKTVSNMRVMMGSKAKPRIQRNFEFVMVFKKPGEPAKDRIDDLRTEDFHLYTMGHWAITPDAPGRKDHVCPFPLELAERVVKLYSPRLGVVLDPFCGRGTTCEAAVLNGRQYVGIDINQTYVATSETRVAEAIERMKTPQPRPDVVNLDAEITKQMKKKITWDGKRQRQMVLAAQETAEV